MSQRGPGSAASSEQVSLLMEFMHEHRDLAKGFTRGPDARDRRNRLWMELTKKLNSLGGAIKTQVQWQKVWADRKHMAKKMAAQLHRAATRTGGGPSVGRQLTDAEERVLAIMGEGFGLPQTKVRTPAILNDENVDPNSLEHTSTPSSPKTVEVHEEMVVHGWDEDGQIITTTEFDHSYLGPPAVQGTSHQPASSNSDMPVCPTPTSSGPARRVRWRSQRRQTDLRSRLLDSERQKMAELNGIRMAVTGIQMAMTGIQMQFAKFTETLTAMLQELKK